MQFRQWLENNSPLEMLRQQLLAQYLGLELWVNENKSNGVIYLSEIRLPKEMQGKGIGTAVIRKIQEYAKQVNLPIVLSPEPNRGKKAALFRFYQNLGFVKNKGRNRDYRISSPFGLSMYWKP